MFSNITITTAPQSGRQEIMLVAGKRLFTIEQAQQEVAYGQRQIELALLTKAALDSRELSDEEKARIADEAEQRREGSTGFGPLDPPPPA